jgi:hypothetical protein
MFYWCLRYVLLRFRKGVFKHRDCRGNGRFPGEVLFARYTPISDAHAPCKPALQSFYTVWTATRNTVGGPSDPRRESKGE